jgi:hypothetical protein
VINTFAWIRAGSNYKDFLIKEFKSAEKILNLDFPFPVPPII